MADSGEPILLFEDCGLDVNENLSNLQNCSFPNDESLILESASSNNCPESVTVFLDTSSDNSVERLKASETYSEIHTDNLDILINTDELSNGNQIPIAGIHDVENNIADNKLIKFDDNDKSLAENYGCTISDFINEENDIQFKDEEFHDAVQFFKDPSSLVFLENAGSSSAPSEPSMARSSLYQKFDPLHAKFFAQSNDLQQIAEDEIEPECEENVFASDKVQNAKDITEPKKDTAVLIEVASDGLQSSSSRGDDSIHDIVKKHISNVSPRQSLGNILISFDSPVINKETDFQNEKEANPPKIYTEDELQQILKIQELSIQETFLKKQHDLEENFLKKQQELEAKFDQQNGLSKSLYAILEEAINLVYVYSDKEKKLQEKLEIADEENKKLRENLKASEEDIQSVETTFSDFHKRYEQCKNMLKVYTENEKSLKQQLENVNTQLHEKEEMYKALQSRTQEMLDKANTEVANAKKAGDAQVAVLKAQLKKAELKISSLESDVQHVKIENGKLSSICDELMAKVSET